MARRQHRDAIGRATFRSIAPQDDVRPTPREIRWLKHLERHGPLSSQHLIALTSDTHRCKYTALRQLQKLRAGGFLHLPAQQRQIAKADFRPFIYDLTPKAILHLRELDLAEPTGRPRGHWWHGAITSAITSAINIAAQADGVRYIPAHEILARSGASLAIPVEGKRLIPDQLFALDYGGRFRLCALEVDRGTEPLTSERARKSLRSAIELYDKVLTGGLHKAPWNLQSNLLVFWVFNARLRGERFLELLREHAPGSAGAIAVQVAVGRELEDDVVRPEVGYYRGPWQRAAGGDVRICR